MDPNALIVQHMLDRQAEIADLRAERDAALAEVARLGELLAERDTDPR